MLLRSDPKQKNNSLTFTKAVKSSDVEIEKTRIIDSAANLLEHEIKECDSRAATSYPSTEDMESRTRCTEFIPPSFRLLLEKMFVAKSTDFRIASVGQAIMQAVRPKVIVASLQIGLGVQMRRQFCSRFLIDSL